jgi:pimeloyl-ACP methyl ester carboxylesterase
VTHLTIDMVLLDDHRAYVDDRSAIRESFVEARLGGEPTVAVLTEPLTRERARGWVICHSLGIERVNLHRLEVLAARALASAGFPVLRYDTPGYGESRRRGEPVTFAHHLGAARDAVDMLASRGGVERVGILGSRFGALVAAAVASERDLDRMALWQPFTDGRSFLANFRHAARFGRLIDRGGAPPHAEETGPDGQIDLNGFVLTRRLQEEIGGLDLRGMRLRGRVLVVGLSDAGGMPAAAAAVADQLTAAGLDCSSALVDERGAGLFGQHQFQRWADERGETDVLRAVFDRLIEKTVAWSRITEEATQPA